MISISPTTFDGALAAWPFREPGKSEGKSWQLRSAIEIPLRNIELKVSISPKNGRFGFLRIDAECGDDAFRPAIDEGVAGRPPAYLDAPDRVACLSNAASGGLVHDPIVRHLSAALENARSGDCEFSAVYADAMRLAIVTRLFHLQMAASDTSVARRHVPLPKWRMKRLIDHVEQNYSNTVTLASMAAAVGLSRMHFAAQFRAATGMRPHQYVMKRRIDAAKQMLSGTGAALVDVALDVGFQSQAHFTTVFKRFTGATPHRWRSEFKDSTSGDGRPATMPGGVG